MTRLSKFRKAFLAVKLFVYVAVPATLLALPASFFDGGESICLSKLLLEMECYACGMTRAIMHLIHFDYVNAMYYNSLSVVVFPMLSFMWAKGFLKDYKSLQRLRKNDASSDMTKQD